MLGGHSHFQGLIAKWWTIGAIGKSHPLEGCAIIKLKVPGVGGAYFDEAWV